VLFVNDKDFERLLSICRIRLSEEEKKAVKGEIEAVIKYFDAVEGIDCDKEEEAYHPVPIPQKLRKDKVEECEDADLLLKNTKTYRFYVVGPKI
jgi:aspartyl/glutamyl-tRNA(Asn/Gln) amidotransferase C subunit